MIFEDERRELIKVAQKLGKYGLISLCGGNVSERMKDGNFLVTPSGMEYEGMNPEDICYITAAGDVLEGNRKPSSDTSALLYVYDHKPEVNAIIHTHQPYATAIGLVEERFVPCLVTQIDALRGGVNVAPFTVSSDVGMGILTVDYAGESLAVILKNHGVIGFGPDLITALYSVVYLEEAAKTYLAARAVGPVWELAADLVRQEAGEFSDWKDYIQR